MMYLDRLRAMKAETSKHCGPSKRSKPGIEGFEGHSLTLISGNIGPIVAVEPNAWQLALAKLDAATAPDGFKPARWGQLVEDARWLADRHGESAGAMGWTAGDLFGLDDQRDGWGGLADRMNGARKVVFTDSLARWQSDDLEGWLWRRTLRPMPTIWEVHTG